MAFSIKELTAGIDIEIRRLTEARNLLAGSESKRATSAPKKRTMSEEGKKRIAEAQRKRWAAQKKLNKKAAA